MVISANAVLTGSYDYGEVARSVLIAIAASYAALDLAGRVTAHGRIRAAWLTGGAIAMGVGIWEMHFKGMLAFQLPVPVAYYWPTVLVSFGIAVLASALALYIVSRQEMGPVQVGTGSLIMGGGIAGLHYLDMSAMRLAAVCRFDHRLVVLSVALAIVFSLAALILAFGLREETRGTAWRRIASALVMGAAISAMHYTGMASATFFASSAVPDLSHAVNISPLANNGIAIITFLVLGAAILTSSEDRRLAAQTQLLERRVIERTLQLTESESRFRLLFEKNLAGVAMTSRGQVLACNEAWARILGFKSPEELRGRPTADFYFNPSDRKPILLHLERGDALLSRELQLRRKDGTAVWVLFNSLSFSATDGTPLVQTTAIDITERKQAEEAQRRLAAIVRSSDDAIVSKDLNGIITSWNAAAQRIFGYSEAEVAGQPITIIIPPEFLKEESLILQRLRAGEHIQHYETVRVTKQGTRVNVSLTISPMRDSEGQVVGASKIARDITERLRTDQSLHEAQAELAHVTRTLAMGELVASIAHEVNQPLTGVVTNANFALRELGSGTPDLEKLREAIAATVEDGTRASDVISRIRALLKKGAPNRVEHDINDVIQEAAVLVRNEAARNHVQVQLDLAAGLPPVLGDRVLVQQVLINLAMNAVEAMRFFTERPRELLIRSAKTAEGVLVQVQDSGPGIEPELANRIFEPFFTTKPEGIGMGLSISRSIVESHGGRLWAESGSQGAVFQFTLPRHN